MIMKRYETKSTDPRPLAKHLLYRQLYTRTTSQQDYFISNNTIRV